MPDKPTTLPQHVIELDHAYSEAAKHRGSKPNAELAALRYEWVVTRGMEIATYARHVERAPSGISKSVQHHADTLGPAQPRPEGNRTNTLQKKWRTTAIQTYILLGYKREPIARVLNVSRTTLNYAIHGLGNPRQFPDSKQPRNDDPPPCNWWAEPINPDLHQQAVEIAVTQRIPFGNATKIAARREREQQNNPDNDDTLRIAEIFYCEQLLDRLIYERWDSALANTIERAIWDGNTEWVEKTYRLYHELAYRFGRLAELFEDDTVRAERRGGLREDAPTVDTDTAAQRAAQEKADQQQRAQRRATLRLIQQGA